MKRLKRCGIVILSLPIALAAVWMIYEIFGMYTNHTATVKQTNTLRMNLENEISDIEIIHVYSETGNITSFISIHRLRLRII